MFPARRSCRGVSPPRSSHTAVRRPTQKEPLLVIRDRPQVGGYNYPMRFVPWYRFSARLGFTGCQRQFVAQACSFPACR